MTKNNSKKSSSNDDVLFLLEKLYGKVDAIDKKVSVLDKKVSVLDKKVSVLDKKVSVLQENMTVMQQSIERLETVTTNSAGDIRDIQENTSVLGYHNSEHFDKDEQQDKRLDRIEHHIQLPAFA